MSLPPLLPVATAVLQPLADRALEGLANGLSFWDTLRGKPEPAETPPVETHQHTAAELDGFLQQLRQRFASLGIRAEPPIRLKPDGQGGVHVDGDHADRVLIEGLFATEPELAEQFQALAHLAARELEPDEGHRAEDFRLEFAEQDAAIDFA